MFLGYEGWMIGVIGAMDEELQAVIADMRVHRTVSVGGRTFHEGELAGVNVVLVVCRIGKVAAATTATLLLERFRVSHVLFTGLAGGIGAGIRVGDVVIADSLIQHDLDARPLFARFEIPMLGLSSIQTDRRFSDAVMRSAEEFTARSHEALRTLGIEQPRVHRGLVASGDQFVGSPECVAELRRILPDVLAVEMEGAAVAQVCHERAIAFAVVRVISDHADAVAAPKFADFLRDACGVYAANLVGAAIVYYKDALGTYR
jgi:adenosylhomocysteine nucleosidase